MKRVSLAETAVRLVGAAMLVCAVGSGCGQLPTDPSQTASTGLSATPRARLLVVTHTTGFRHDSIPVAESTLQTIGDTTGLFDTEFCRDGDAVRRLLTRDGLAPFSAVFFANTTGNLGIPDLGAFLAWVGDGHAFLGAHSAADTYHDEPRYLEMLGNEFLTHGAEADADMVVEDPMHPAVAHLGARWRVFDEIYRFTHNNRQSAHLLLSLDRYPQDGLPDAGRPADLPLAWYSTYGSGRVFYTALGHRDDVWRDQQFRQHLAGAIRWAMGR
jgi:type 1 glutamine amidotransferase